MDSDRIRKYLDRRCGKDFTGVFSSDTLPTHLKKPALLVCNTDVERLPGEHWIAIYIGASGEGEFFDSFGREPGQPFRDFMEKHSLKWTFNSTPLQNIRSSFCGHYCLFYCVYRRIGFNMNSIVRMFCTDTMINDYLVHKFVCG